MEGRRAHGVGGARRGLRIVCDVSATRSSDERRDATATRCQALRLTSGDPSRSHRLVARSSQSLFGAVEETFSRFLRRLPKQNRSRSVVSAVVEAFEEQLGGVSDPDEVTIDAVIDRAGVGVGSFYEYFASKDAVLAAVIGRVTDRNFVALAARLNAHECGDIHGLIELFARDLAEVYLTHPRRLRLLAHAAGRLGLMGVVHRERDRFAAKIQRRVLPLLPEEELARVGRTMQLLADAGMGIFLGAAEREPPTDRDAVAAELADLAHGLVSRRHPSAGAA